MSALKGYLWKIDLTDETGVRGSGYLVSETETISSATSFYRVLNYNFDPDSDTPYMCQNAGHYHICGVTSTTEEVMQIDYNKRPCFTVNYITASGTDETLVETIEFYGDPGDITLENVISPAAEIYDSMPGRLDGNQGIIIRLENDDMLDVHTQAVSDCCDAGSVSCAVGKMKSNRYGDIDDYIDFDLNIFKTASLGKVFNVFISESLC